MYIADIFPINNDFPFLTFTQWQLETIMGLEWLEKKATKIDFRSTYII